VKAWILLCCLACSACAGTVVRAARTPSDGNADALLVLPGFGYGPGGERTLRALAPTMAQAGVDLYVPTYLRRSGLDNSRARLDRFIRDHRLSRYQRVHVFAFIAGAWTANPLIERGELPRLASVIYDRSPFQERAPRIAAAQLRVLAWLRYGSTLFDVARTPYPPLAAAGVRIGLLVESRPTRFVKRHEQAARRLGPFAFACDALAQPYDDCAYLAMNHDQLYERFAEVWPELLAFIRTGRFSELAVRMPPSGDALAEAAQP
jgi:hypothetical protein